MGTTFMEGRLGNLDSQSEVYVPNYWWGANLRNLEIMFSVLRKKLLCLLIAGRSATTRSRGRRRRRGGGARARARPRRRRPAGWDCAKSAKGRQSASGGAPGAAPGRP
eukprot:SAG25_NODE_230_length_11432_cov_34.362481_11_plen_108_part_00